MATGPTAAPTTPRIVDLTSTTHEGKVVVVGTGEDGRLHYTVRQSGFEDTAIQNDGPTDMPGFEHWRPVPVDRSLPDASVLANEKKNLVDPTGTPVLRSRYRADAAASLAGRAKLISGLGHLYVFRVSADHKLLMNRFVLDGMTNELVPKLEVRFRRSRQKLEPEGGTSASGKTGHDTLGFRDPDQRPFYEPTLELSFLGTFDEDKPWFSVELLPTAEHERFRWNFFVYADGALRLVSVAASAEGLIDPTDQIKSQPDPDKVDRKIIRTVPGIVDRRLRLPGQVAAAFDSSLYHNQVERKTKAGSQLLKDSTRVMLSVPLQQKDRTEPVIAAVSFSVDNLGQLAQIDRTAQSDDRLIGDAKEVLLPLSDLDDITLIADRTPPPEGAINRLAESPDQQVSISTDVELDGKLSDGQRVKVSGTRSYDGVYTATNVADGSFEIAAVFSESETDQGYWEAIEDTESGLVFENMIASYERTETGGLKISCLSHNLSDGDEIRISGSANHDGIYPVTDVSDDNSFELDQVWPAGEVVNLSRRPRRGLTFDGDGDYLRIDDVEVGPHASDARLERTVSAWVNLNAITAQPQTIFAAKSGMFHLYVDRTGKATFEVQHTDGHRSKVVDPTPLPTQSWIHVSAMFDYQGETTGDTVLTMCRGGVKAAETVVASTKPLHLPIRNLSLKRHALPINTVQYDMTRTSAITVEAWIKPGGDDDQHDVLSWLQNGMFILLLTGDRQGRHVSWQTGRYVLSGKTHLQYGQWHHIAATFDPATGRKTVVVNGVLDASEVRPTAVSQFNLDRTEEVMTRSAAVKKPVLLGYLGSRWQMGSGTPDSTVMFRTGNRRYQQVTFDRWQEFDGENNPVGDALIEAGRSGNVIALRDEANTYRIEMNVLDRRVDRADFAVATDLAAITGTQTAKAADVTRLEFRGSWSSRGSLERVDATTWREVWINNYGASNQPQNPNWDQVQPARIYREYKQGDDNAIWLRQEGWTEDHFSKCVSLARRLVLYGTDDGPDGAFSASPNASLHDSISRIEAPSKVAISTASLNRVDFAGGYYEITMRDHWKRYGGTGERNWQRYDRNGNATSGQLIEIERTDRSITIQDYSGREKWRFDLTDQMVRTIKPVVRTRVGGLDETNQLTPEADITNRFTGSVADVRVWKRARSERQIRSNAAVKLTGKESDLVGHWPLHLTGARELSDLSRSRAHIELSDGESAAWLAEPHRTPGDPSHYEGSSYQESYTLGSDLDHRDRHVLALDGTGAHLKLASLADDLSNGYTVAAWARWDSFNHWSRVIDFGNGPGSDNIVLANLAKTNNLALAVPGVHIEAEGVLKQGQWMHVAATLTGEGEAVLYVDGKQAAAGTLAAPETVRRTKNFIGRSNWPHDAPFQGAIRDVQFWGQPLGADEIKRYMNAAPQGHEEGLLHHWSMRAATVNGQPRVIDHGPGNPRNGQLIGGASVAAEVRSGPPSPMAGYRGKLSDVQLWEVNRPIDTVRQTMHDQLTGQEYGLVGYWRCGGIVDDGGAGAVNRISPDFASEPHDATVVGDVYVSARELPRSNSVGRAVKYRNDDLVAVAQRGRYRETFDFRAVTLEGSFLAAEEVINADGRNGALFEFSYWGRKSRVSTERIDFGYDQAFEFEDLGDGWFRAACEVTIPDGVNLIRCFELSEVNGLWTDGDVPPDGEWMSLEVRKHRLELISDSITRRRFSDEIDLPTLVENASALESTIKRIPLLERRIAAAQVELSEVLEALIVFSQQPRYNDEQSARNAAAARLRTEIATVDAELAAYRSSPLADRLVLRGAGSGLVLDLPHWRLLYQFWRHDGNNQVWQFEQQTDGTYKIATQADPGHYITSKGSGQVVGLSTGDASDVRWRVEDRGAGRYRIINVGDGLTLDVKGGTTDSAADVIVWPFHGGNNQLWHLDRWRGGSRKPTFDAEVERITRPRERKAAALTKEESRLTWLNEILSDLSDAKKTALEENRDRLEKTVRTLQDQVNRLNTSYIQTAASADSAQSMALVAEDPLGLKTYGALLGFAAPAGGATSTATAEGNVQLSYFDSQGRFRFTDYDATSSQDNASYEEWLPSTIAVCPDLGADNSMLRLEDGGAIPLDPARHTTEAWFYYPPPLGPSGFAAPLSRITSDRAGRESTIAIADGRRLGTLVDGFFHDVGVDLSVDLDNGWHHVAARAEGAVTEFFLDGEPVGQRAAEQRSIERYAMNFPATDGGLSSPRLQTRKAIPDAAFSGGFSVQAWARWDSLGYWSRIIDFGNGMQANNILLGNAASTDDLSFWVYSGSTPMVQLTASGVVRIGDWMNVAATVGNGVAILYVDGREVGRADCANPPTASRPVNYIGLSNWWTNGKEMPFHGDISDVRVWQRPLSAAEVDEYAYAQPPADAAGLLYHWPMKLKEVDGSLVADDPVGGNNCDLVETTGRQLSGRATEPVVAFGNSVNGGSPIGRLAELRFWSTALSDEEIRIHSRIKLSGNEPDLVASYPLDDVLGAEPNARDRTGANPQAVPQAMMPVARTARIGHPGAMVAKLNGSGSDRLEVDGFDLGGKDFTIEYWVKRGAAGRREWMVSQGRRAEGQAVQIGFIQHNEVAFGFYQADLHACHHRLADADEGVNSWTHVAASYDRSTGKRRLYLDGRKVAEDTTSIVLTASGPLVVGSNVDGKQAVLGQMAEVRVWDHVRSADQVAQLYNRRALGTETGLVVHLPLDRSGASASADANHRVVRSDDLPIIPGPSLMTAEYSTVGIDPANPDKRRAVLRRFYGYAADGGRVGLLAGKKVEELQLKWIGNAQFEPTLLGYMEGAPPVPSENLTINYDYDSATSVELVQSDEVSYSWNRNREVAAGLDINTFLGAAWSVSGGAFIETKLTEGHAGARGTLNTQTRDSQGSMIRASSTESSRDRLDLRGAYEIEPAFAHLGNRFVPKNVGYALVISGLADVFITQTKRTGRMIAYEVLPVEDMPPEVNTITFLINPAYTMNGSLDGLVGSHAADPRFYKHVPEMRAQYGSRYPASYFNLRQAYDLKAQIERWDKQRESYFANFDASETGLGDEALEEVPDSASGGSYGQIEIADGPDDGDGDSTNADGEPRKPKEPSAKDVVSDIKGKAKGDISKVKKRWSEIQDRFDDLDKVAEANTAFASWQRKMEGLQIQAAKRNIFNTYVWDADGGIRFEEQSFANTIEHTIGGSFSVNSTLGFDGMIQVAGFKGELQAMSTQEMSQTMSKTESSTRSFELNVRLDGLERKGITDAADYPILPGEKVDRYRFMSFYLEGDVDHFTDFFDYVVDPEWLMSNDEEARALRQVARGRPNKTWRVMHRVTYVERPALMGFGRDLRTAADQESASREVFNYFDSLEQDNAALRAEVGAIGAHLQRVGADVIEIKKAGSGAGAGQRGDTGPAASPDSRVDSGTESRVDGGVGDGGETIDLREQPGSGSGSLSGIPAPVDINRATAAALEALPGVGSALAARIIAFRDGNGGFASVDALTGVSGIGPSLLKKLRPLLAPLDGHSTADSAR